MAAHQLFAPFGVYLVMASIVVSGDVLRRPRGSNLAAHLHYLIGLRKLGHDVAYLEESGASADAEGRVPREGLMLLGDLLRRCRVDIPVVWVDSDAGLVGGMVWPQLRRRLRSADLLLDIGGKCWLAERALPRRRALLDIEGCIERDPLEAAARQTNHDLYFTNRRDPDERLAAEWLPTIPPVVPRLWYGPPARAEMPLKVLVGRGSEQGGLGPSEGDGARVGQLVALPARLTPRPWTPLPDDGSELAQQLTAAGWSVRAEAAVDLSLSAYRAQLIGSQACLNLSDDRHVWFTSHDASFLAAGRPLILGDRDIDCWMPTGAGVLTYQDLGGAIDAVEHVARELPRHAAAARDIAERVFHFSVVLPNLLSQALPRHLHAVA
jgi:hypothetical protein